MRYLQEGGKQYNCSMLKMVTSEVTINLNIFCMFGKDLFVRNFNETLVITIDESWSKKGTLIS